MKNLLLTVIIFALLVTLTVAQSTTPNIGLTLPNFNAPNWNIPLNNNFSIIDLVFSSGTCGDSSHALNFDASTKRIGCQTLTGGGGGGGTVTHTTGSLTLNNFILGNGGGDIKDSGFSILPLVNGGTGTPTPNLIAGANVTITGTWPNQTINAAGAGSPSFSVITAGTNTSALLMGSGGSLGVTGSGTIGATTLLGGTWAIPGNIGSTTPATGAFTDLSSTTTGTFNNLTVTGVCTGCAGGTTAFGSITSGTSTGTLLVGTGGSLAATGTGTITASNFLGLTAGTSGGVPYFSSSSALSSSAVLTANLPVIGGGAGSAPTVGTRTGNTTQFASWTGATTASRCVDTDASGNLKITTADCNAGTVTSVGETFTGGLISVGGSPITTSGTLALTVAGTSGGIPYFSGPTSWASSALLAANAVMIGGGSGTTPSTISSDSTTTHALFATAGAPAFRALTSGDLPSGYNAFSNLTSSTNTAAAMLLGTGSSLATAGVGSINGVLFPNTTETIQQAMTAASTNGLSVVPPNYAGADSPAGTRIINLSLPTITPQSNGARLLDQRYGEMAESVYNPGFDSLSSLWNAYQRTCTWNQNIGNAASSPSSGALLSICNTYQSNWLSGTQNFNQNGYNNKTQLDTGYVQSNAWTPGQVNAFTVASFHYSNGDSLPLFVNAVDYGGSSGGSDEGLEGVDFVLTPGPEEPGGTISSGASTGSTSIGISFSQGGGHQGVGSSLIDVTKATSVGTVTSISGSGVSAVVTFSGTSFTTSTITTTSAGISNPALTTTTSAITVTGSQSIPVVSSANFTPGLLVTLGDGTVGNFETVTVTAVADSTHFTAAPNKTHLTAASVGLTQPGLVNIQVASSTGILVNDIVGIFDAATAEFVKVTAVPDGTHITAVFTQPHASGATISDGGIMGQGFELTADRYTASSGWGFVTPVPPLRQVWYVIGCTTGTSCRIWISVAGLADSYSGMATFPSAAYTLYPMALITSVVNGGATVSSTLTLAPNNAAWVNGDTVSVTPFPTRKTSLGNWQINLAHPSQGIAAMQPGLIINGPMGGNDLGWGITNKFAATNYAGMGGNLTTPQAGFETTGVFGYNAFFNNPGRSGMIWGGCPYNSSGVQSCASGNDAVIVLANNSSGTDDIEYSPSSEFWRIHFQNNANSVTFGQINNGIFAPDVTSSLFQLWNGGGSNGIMISGTAPTISSGFGSTPSITANGTASFSINVGTGGSASSGIVAFNSTATHGWAIHCDDVTTQSTSVFITKQTASSTTTATITQYNTAGSATAWVASDILECQAMGN